VRALAAVAVVVLALPACSRAPPDPVAALLAELESAAEARDAERFAAQLASEFRGERGLGRAEAAAELRRYFAAYESVALEVYGVEVERGAGAARVRCVVEFSGRARSALGLQGLLPPEAVYRFELELAEAKGGLRVRAARWEPAVAAAG
jgi:hypothetical protein